MPPKKRSRSVPSLEGKVFCFVGFKDQDLAEMIETAGGTIASTMRVKAITHVVCQAGSENLKSVQDASAKGIEVQSKEDLEAELKGDTPAPPAKKQVADPDPPKSGRGKKAVPAPAPAPPSPSPAPAPADAPTLDTVAETMFPGASLVVDGTEALAVQLSKVEGRKKTTTFLNLQLILVPKKGRKAQSYQIFSRSGQTGTDGDVEIIGSHASLAAAKTEFESVFKGKTGNEWSDLGSFAAKKGCFSLDNSPPATSATASSADVSTTTTRRGRSATGSLPVARPATPSPPPAATKAKKSRTLPSGPPPLVSTPSTTQAGCIDSVAHALLPHASVVVHGGDVYDVSLSQIDISQNMDKYYIIQLLLSQTPGTSDQFHVFTRWGRTGQKGQTQMQGAFDTLEEAQEAFEEKFKEKTQNNWSDRHKFKAKKGHYNLLRVDHVGKTNRRAATGPPPKWEYYVDDFVDGKATGWYEYADDGSEQTEELWVTFQSNPHMCQRVVESGTYEYLVDLVNMTQTNVKHPARKVRNIRRNHNGVLTQGTGVAGVKATTSSTTSTAASSATVTLPAPAVPAPAPAPVVGKAPRKAIVPTAAASSGPTLRPVDSHCPMSSRGSVRVVNDYDIMLNQADIKANKNKFYRLQLLQEGSTYYFWTRWGRVGEVGQSNLDNCGSDVNQGIAAFKKKFKDKTGERWEDGPPFTPRSGKYEVIEMKTAATAAIPLAAIANSSVVPPSKLDPKTKELMETIFDLDMFKTAMTDIKVDLTRMPLGAITVSQLDKGYAVLKEIEALLAKKSLNSREKDYIVELSGNFYQVIPHSYPRSVRPPPINDIDLLTEKINMINTLKDIEIAQSVLGAASAVSTMTENPIDAKYSQLDADIELVDPTSPDYGHIKTAMDRTLGSYNRVKLYDIWRVRRHPEDTTFPAFESMPNHHLLWHGTNVAVVAAILKTGLRIMPAVNGGRVGRGIYLADQLEKSVSYVRPTRRADGTQFGLAFLSQAAMGRVKEITRDDGSLVAAPSGYDSVIARGTQEPNPAARTTFQIDGTDVTMHHGTSTNTGVSSSFGHNEYLVYRESQQRLRYIISFKL